MNYNQLAVTILLLYPVLGQFSYNCALLQDGIYVDLSGITEYSRQDNNKHYFEMTKGKFHYQLNPCALLEPTCTNTSNRNILTWYEGSLPAPCQGPFRESDHPSLSLNYGTLL